MYFSIIDNKEYWVVLRDGVVEKMILELPSEKLADEVAFQLQMAWNDGESWGKTKMRKWFDPEEYQLEISKSIKNLMNRGEYENNKYNEELEQKLKYDEMKVRQQVLRLKTPNS
ncbi:hypothetical protein [Paenibacillus tundrae]|uniref:hypothetical protein n=1 Tax=Paenibacillus tundrae TaxID=528187 RepID=UPI0030D6232E